uniref:ATP-dependent DNA helicase n=1 Tax=Lactuca sativa TaxID=4236 RepID=A0A9R1VXB2_LACSA|nr:hypothetical protein LSAT_V11C400161710 [Lactuca sativa]
MEFSWQLPHLESHHCFCPSELRHIHDLRYQSINQQEIMTLLGDLMQHTSVIIWDEAPMSDRRCFEYLDRYLWDVLDCNEHAFGQISMLTQNVRLLSNTYNGTHSLSSTFFADWLLQIGDELVVHPDTDDPQDTSWIQIQDSLLIPPGSASLKNLIEFVYGTNILNNPITADLLVRAIVCPKNKMADIINRIILKTIGTCGKIYNKYLNQLTFTGIPPHALNLKGLCNGTRLFVSQLLPTVAEATIITYTCIVRWVYIPRIKFIHRPSNLPITFSRKQFPIKLCYTMTINKSQGQSLKKIVFICLNHFSHGQATSRTSLKIFLETNETMLYNQTKNFVYRDLLRKFTPNEVHQSHLHSCALIINKQKVMSSISELKCDGVGAPIQVRIIRKWKHEVHRYETRYLAVDRFRPTASIVNTFRDTNNLEGHQTENTIGTTVKMGVGMQKEEKGAKKKQKGCCWTA